ncbi:proline racemase family protein [Thiomonas sp. FB-Cd]|uniref:proline racemase family protein n=1 Tax=Thiomonas sp. FB-Cd TaxID=1158292 RepID=UPI0004DED683|nr:proline racemase family protein [Thiomonas sp. FB-Cd]
MTRTLRFIDSHTGGEPTRVLLEGIPRPARGRIREWYQEIRREYGWLLAAAVNEPRGSDILVGAAYWPPTESDMAGEVMFFNNVGLLGMCGHGTIGLVVSLAHLGRLAPGLHTLHTPVGNVRAFLREDGRVRVQNVPSYRHRKNVAIDVPGYGGFIGDVAWGGNWFYIVEHGQDRIDLSNRDLLTELCWAIRGELRARGITGRDGAEIDHIELSSARDAAPGNDAKNFVLCSGKAYDRSPCGTGTSARLACLAADGVLGAGQTWRQESVTGSVFEGNYESCTVDDDGVAWIKPSITGSAQVTAVGELLFDEAERAADRWA